MARQWFRIEMIIDASVLHTMMLAARGKALAGSLKVDPVVHGGESNDDDEAAAPPRGPQTKLTPTPTGRQFVYGFIAKQTGHFTTTDVGDAAEAAGISRASVYNAMAAASEAKLVKRIDKGVYAPTGKATKVAAPKVAKAPKANGSHASAPVSRRVLDLLHEMQNGSGEGVPLKVIRDTLGGINVSPTLTDLLKSKLIVRTAPATYRTAAVA
jgi:hypothetical protein